MKKRRIREDIYFLGAPDWERRIFDALIPLPSGTSYNAYLIKGRDGTALIDTVDPSKRKILLHQLQGVERIDYIVSQHAEQDHSGCIPEILKRYEGAKVLTTPQGKAMLIDLLEVSEERIITVKDGETLSLGDRTLEFIYAPWVHWPETMVTYLKEEKILFTCDLFGSHLATASLYASEEGNRAFDEAKRYYATIMMPFHRAIEKNLKKIEPLEVDLIAPSHGPIYDHPPSIVDRYRDWVSERVRNLVLLPYVSMHGSTRIMVEYLTTLLAEDGIEVKRYDLTVADLGALASDLVGAATLVIGTPVMLGGIHPHIVNLLYVVNLLKPKLRFISLIGSYGWAGRVVEQLKGLTTNLKTEFIEPVLCKGLPKDKDFEALEALAGAIRERHKDLTGEV